MTRLLLIHGSKAAMYEGASEIHLWDTNDIECPVDLDHYESLETQVFSAEWLKDMSDAGRRFPKFISDFAKK